MERKHNKVRFPHILKPPRGFNNRLERYNPPPIDHVTLFDLITQTENTIRELQQIRDGEPSSNLLLNIGRSIGAVLESAGDAGSEIISTLGSAIKDTFDGFGDSNAKIIESLGNSASDVISSMGGAVKDAATEVSYIFKEIFGGIPGILIWCILGPLTIYIIYLSVTGRLGPFCHCHRAVNNTDNDIYTMEMTSLTSTGRPEQPNPPAGPT